MIPVGHQSGRHPTLTETNYAHTKGLDPANWEPLKDHLFEVAKLAGDYASRLSVREMGEIAGLLHDIGKYAPAFQAYLRQEGPGTPHAIAGAHVVAGLLPPTLSKLLAYAIAGHHAGLPDGGREDDACLHASLEALSPPSAWGAWCEEISHPALAAGRLTIPRILEEVQRGTSKHHLAFAVQMLGRMVFSCLVDADFLCTERFMRPERVAERAPGSDLDTLVRTLDRHLAGLPADGEVNRQRAEILGWCRDAAARPPGVFTLTVPTGGGKTLSSLAFALDHARAHGLDRVIHVIPYTSIIEQTAAVFRGALAPHAEAVVEHHSTADPDASVEPGGEGRLRLATENWDAPIIVTTAVQFFESLFAARPSRCRKLHNIANAVVVLDEAQTLPLHLLTPCVAALDELVRRYNVTLVLSTATQPILDHPRLAVDVVLPKATEIARDVPGLFRAMRRAEVRTIGALRDDELALELCRRSQALCIVDHRGHAQALFEAVREIENGAAVEALGGEGSFHLSAAMCPAHRRAVLDQARSALADGRPCRLVATRVVEAGVDIDFPVVLRAIAGLDSIEQAAGRCNRENRRAGGEVLVFEPEDTWKTLPELARRAEVGRAVLAEHAADPRSLDAIRAYFDRLLEIEGAPGRDVFDRGGAYRALSGFVGKEDAPNIPFRSVAERFRLIEEDTVPILIPWGSSGEAAIAELDRALRHGGDTRAARRRAQQIAVSVRPYAARRLEEDGAAWRLGGTGDGPLALVCPEPHYDPRVGLRAGRPGERSPADNIL